VEGFKSAKNTMQKILNNDENVTADGVLEESSDTEEEIIEALEADGAVAESTNIAEAVTEES
ncbi:MAG: hypothetical protein K2O65_15230, partial [Lachnospiraceae bacterium]|nr:hypothetical protein [Lachnospiraceae bacterium]